MKLVVLSLAFVFGSFTLSAQSTGSQGVGVAGMEGLNGQSSAQQTMALQTMRVSSGCPVAMRLNQAFSGGLREAGKGQSSPTYSAKLHLLLSQIPRGKIVAASAKTALVTVRGYDATPRFELVSPADAPLVKMMKIQFVPVNLKGATADFRVVGIVSASSLDIDSLTYADGSSWKPAQGQTCTVTPNPIVLIGANYNSGAAKP
jgi:hypothetical protein